MESLHVETEGGVEGAPAAAVETEVSLGGRRRPCQDMAVRGSDVSTAAAGDVELVETESFKRVWERGTVITAGTRRRVDEGYQNAILRVLCEERDRTFCAKAGGPTAARTGVDTGISSREVAAAAVSSTVEMARGTADGDPA